jgi:hypothetical protein
MILRQALRRQTAKDFYSLAFQSFYGTLQNAARQTPLVIMLWGSCRRIPAWSVKRIQIRDRLEKSGHTVFFGEQLGIPAAALTRRAVEYVQSETADLVIAMQPTYDSVGAVRHFAEHRVVDRKMLLFVDDAAPDRYLYDHALTDLKNLYNNVETYRSPEDIAGDNLVSQILDKVGVMQIVKYRAIQRARGWGLKLEDPPSNPPGSVAPLQPFRYNLLELFREHRDEIEVLSNPLSLFCLYYIDHAGCAPLCRLSQDVDLTEDALLKVIAPLLRGEMIFRSEGTVAATAFGKRMLEGLGLSLPAAPMVVQRPAAPLPMSMVRKRFAAITAGAGLALAAVMLFSLSLLHGASLTVNQQPLAITPARPALTATATHIPAPTLAPMPPASP